MKLIADRSFQNRKFTMRDSIIGGILLTALIILPVLASAQSARTRALADARWGAFWTQFRSAVNSGNRKQVVALASKDFWTAGGDTIHTFLDGETDGGKDWSGLRRSIRRGTKPHGFDEGKVWRITRNSNSPTVTDLLFVFENGKWRFWGEYESS